MLVPLLWDIPSILTVLELNSMMPVTGGYYQWVKRALGMRFAFYEGWWTWLYTFVDLAIYPVLFIEYAGYFFPEIEPYKIPIGLFIIWSSAGLNILGIVRVGKTALLLSIIVLVPFIVLFAMAFWEHGNSYSLPHLSLKGLPLASLGMGLYTVMWNFIGWDNTTTYAQEVNNPVRSYLLSVAIAFLLIFSVYFLAVVTVQLSGIDLGILNESGFPAVGELIAGHWLGVLIAAGGMASALGLYSAVLLSVSRVPQVMANDGLLPKRLTALHPRFNTPYISIIICSLVVSCMIMWTFADLLIIDVMLYGAGLFLEFVSLVILRVKLPDVHRPFKIPLSKAGLCLMISFPVGIYFIALAGAFSESGGTIKPALFAIAALFSAELGWRIVKAVTKKFK
jgi:amino acid transporter